MAMVEGSMPKALPGGKPDDDGDADNMPRARKRKAKTQAMGQPEMASGGAAFPASEGAYGGCKGGQAFGG